MPPLPPYNFRPLKRQEATRTGAAAGVRELAESLSEKMAVRAGRLSVKPEPVRGKPQLKVLGRAEGV